MPDTLYACSVILLGYVVLGITGFGSSLVVVPLLSWKWPLADVVLLALMLDIPASAILAGLNVREVDRSEFAQLLPGMAVGSGAGLWLHGAIDPRWPILALGIYVCLVGVRALFAVRGELPRVSSRWQFAAGIAAGLVEVMFATAGPVVLAWLNRRLPSIRAVRATTPVTMTVCAATALVVMTFGGGLSGQHAWERWALLLLVAATGVVIGNRVARHVSVLALKRAVCSMLVLSGVALVVRVA